MASSPHTLLIIGCDESSSRSAVSQIGVEAECFAAAADVEGRVGRR